MSESIATLLDNKSSSKQKFLKPSYRDTLLQSCADEVLSAEYIYGYFDQEHQTDRLSRFCSCRTGAFFYRNQDTGAIRVGSQSCHLRFCPLCNKAKVTIIKENTTAWLKSVHYPKMITFTLKHSQLPLNEQLKKLYSSFREIRRNKILKKNCVSGIWFFQIKQSKFDHAWHPHIHCIVAGHYVPHGKLSRAWLRITGDSKIVDIRLIKDVDTAARHISRYAAKPCSLSNIPLDDCIELAEALESKRLCGTWGACRNLKLTSMPVYDHSRWVKLASWFAVVTNHLVDDNAKAIFDAWRKGTPLEREINIDHLFRDTTISENINVRGSPSTEYLPFY